MKKVYKHNIYNNNESKNDVIDNKKNNKNKQPLTGNVQTRRITITIKI